MDNDAIKMFSIIDAILVINNVPVSSLGHVTVLSYIMKTTLKLGAGGLTEDQVREEVDKIIVKHKNCLKTISNIEDQMKAKSQPINLTINCVDCQTFVLTSINKGFKGEGYNLEDFK